jgi:alkylhydroperoxidase family enzyme
VKLTEAPWRVGAADLEPLRRAGLSDPEIHDLVQVIAYFNYVTRIADALGTDPEREMGARPPGWGRKGR